MKNEYIDRLSLSQEVVERGQEVGVETYTVEGIGKVWDKGEGGEVDIWSFVMIFTLNPISYSESQSSYP